MNMYKSLLALVLLSGLFHFRLSGQQGFDIYSFQIPEGYRAQNSSGSLVLSSPDDKLSILLIPVKPCTDIAYLEFGKDWNQFVTSRYSVLGFPNRITTEFSGGWEMTTGQAKVFNDKETLWIQIRNFTKLGRKATILFFAVDDKQQETILKFVDGLDLSEKPGNENVATERTLSQKESKAADSSTSGYPNIEIWMRIKSGTWNMSNDYYSGNSYDISKNRMAYKILFPDGKYTGEEIPRKGFIGFNSNSPDAPGYTWGTYRKSTNTLSLQSDYENLTLNYRSPDILENPSSSFLYYKCRSVDGLKLNGSWSYIPDSDKDPYYDEPGCRQVISFRTDMTFDDRGVFVSDCGNPNQYPENSPGSGTYNITGFTLILKYDDGRIMNKSFTGALMNDPFKRDEIIYIGGINFFKRSNVITKDQSVKSQDLLTLEKKPSSISYDNFKFSVPDGWQVKESSQFLEIYPSNLKEKEIFSIILLKGKTSSAPLKDELASAWDEFASILGAQKLNQVSGNYYNSDEPSRTYAGWEYQSGHGSMRSNGDFFVHAYIIRVGDRIERVIVLAKEIWLDGVRNNIDPTVHHYPYFLTITDFIFNLEFRNFPSEEKPKSSIRGTGITGVWAGLGFMGGQLKTTYMIFFSNGQVYYGSRFPITGIYELNTYADKERNQRYWGTYQFSGGSGAVTMSYGNFPIRMDGESLIASPISEEHKFIKIPSIDNVKLAGKWTISDQSDRPASLLLRADGTFSDDGALKVLDHSLYEYYSIADGGGSGKYSIKDYTIIFNYDDGRELRIAFPGLDFNTSDPSPSKLILSFNNDILVKQ